MCGIIGIFGNNNYKERAHQSLEKIIHRGGDVFELEHFDNAIIGANRLPIVDRENGRQPKSNEDKNIFVVLNGEVFNYRLLKKELINKGHKFRTDSDTEVLAHLYEEYGSEMIHKIDSEMFAFIIYDKRDKSIFVARDALGVKPLYYARDKTNQLYFASELKQLSFFNDIDKIYNFPPGSYFYKNKIKKYFGLKSDNKLKDEEEVVKLLEKQIVEAVAKRVDTDLPIGVFLSGGVDSSLIMEIATRLHPDVTAIILGYPGSSDYEYALKLCLERKYKYHTIRPDVNYKEEVDNLIYHLETYEPLIIRQSFPSDICSREAQRLGLKVVLVGEGADELFGGYNEFSNLPPNLINQGCLMLTESLSTGHLLRVDRMGMKHTVEVRSPFFDNKIVETALKIDGSLKIKRQNHQIITKYVLRKLATNFLPDYIAYRYKMPMANGAGMNVGSNYKSEDGEVAKAVMNNSKTDLSRDILNKYKIKTNEEKYYLNKFKEFSFTKLVNSEKRLVVKDNLNDLYKSDKTKILVAEFDRLALYFPVYFAAENNFFQLHKLDIDFISTGGDDKTYASLVNTSAQIGLSDPMFAMFENKEGVKGEIIAELVNKSPNLAVAINPNVSIKSLNDFKNYKIGTFEKYSTTNTIVNYILPKGTDILAFEHGQVIQKLVDRVIDVAVVLPEQAINLELVGGKIIYDFKSDLPKFLFTGFTIANTLEPKYKKALKSFIIAVRESVRYIYKNKDEAYKKFIKLFPELKEPEKVFVEYLRVWSTNLKTEKDDYNNAHKSWRFNYPELLKNYQPYFRNFSVADPIIEKINSSRFRRDYPFLEDKIEKNILESLETKKPLKLFGFWGASSKKAVDNNDIETINYFKEYIKNIRSSFRGEIEITWILADEHANNNSYNKNYYNKYLKEISVILKNNGFDYVYLSELWKKWGISSMSIKKILKDKKSGWWDTVNISKLLEIQAKKRSSAGYLIGAQKYYIMRKLEKRYLEQEFKDSIFLVFGNGQSQSIYPKLPTIYLYSQKGHFSNTPWFIN